MKVNEVYLYKGKPVIIVGDLVLYNNGYCIPYRFRYINKDGTLGKLDDSTYLQDFIKVEDAEVITVVKLPDIGQQQINELKDVITILQQIDSQLFFDEIANIMAKVNELETKIK